MITINQLGQAVHEARMNTIRHIGRCDGKVVVVLSYPDYMSLRADPMSARYFRAYPDEDLTIMGARLLRSPDLKEGEIKILADLGTL